MKTVKNIVMLSLIAITGALSSACDSDQAAQAEDQATPASAQVDVAVDSLHIDPIAGAVQAGQLRNGVFNASAESRGRDIAPGVSELETEDGVQQVIVGEAGHEWLLAQSTARLDELHAELAAGTDDEDLLLGQIAAAEEELDAVNATLKHMKDLALPGDPTLGVSCNVGLYAGPSGPVYGAAGAAALAQTACYGGCTAITVRSQACCNGACTPLSYITNTNVCANPWTAGSIRLGIGAGQAQVYVAPVTVTNLGFTCG